MTEITCTINVICLTHSGTTPRPSPWKNCLPRKRSLGPKKLVTAALKHQGLLQGRFWTCAHTPHQVSPGTASTTHSLSSVNASGAEAKAEKGHAFSEQRSNLSLREREGLTPVYLEAVGAHGGRKSGLLSPWSGSSVC